MMGLGKLWERFNDVPGGNAARYYLGPAYGPISGLANLGVQSLPGADLVDMQQQSANLMASKSPGEALGNLGWLGASVAMGALPGTAGALREGVEEAVPAGIRAFHGSPHDFDRFSMDKIGTGEGAQAYGRGLYFAEREGVAKSYRDALTVDPRDDVNDYLTDLRNFPPKPGEATVERFRTALGNSDKATLRAVSQNDEMLSALVEITNGINADGTVTDAALAAYRRLDKAMPAKPKGHMYEVEIKANPEDFLDWDKPLSEQSEKVRGALTSVAPHLEKVPNVRGEDAYRGAVGRVAQERGLDPRDAGRDANAALGIPGIRYLDGGSRAAGEGASNYVVFDENLISILRKYGLGGLMAGGATMGSLYGMPEEQQY